MRHRCLFTDSEPAIVSKRERETVRDRFLSSDPMRDDAWESFSKWFSTSVLYSEFHSAQCELRKVP